jgi:23S rRNA pseudouridine1911/1915/1917 synthase
LLPSRDVDVPESGEGLRLDRFLALRFPDWSRTALARGIKAGLVADADGRVLRAAHPVRAGQRLVIRIPGLAATEPPPPLPPVVYEDERVVVLDKPPGLSCHPGGSAFEWAVVGLARARWRGADLVHRLDKETSGLLVLTKDGAANATLKAAFKADRPDKRYVALVRGRLAIDGVIDAPIGPAEGPIRIQMAVRPDGLPARTTARARETREAGGVALTWVDCALHTGRTHQIRVHLAHVGAGVVGDRMYGVPPEVFLEYYDHGVTDAVIAAAGAPRHALHAAWLRFPHPDGGEVEVEAPVPGDMARWWADPGVLPFDREA